VGDRTGAATSAPPPTVAPIRLRCSSLGWTEGEAADIEGWGELVVDRVTRAVTAGLLLALATPVLMPMTTGPALATACEATLDASDPDAVARLQELLDRAATPGDPATTCATWTLRLSGTFALHAQLEYRGIPRLHLTGASPTGPAVLAGTDERLLALLAPARELELTDLVLRDGSARGSTLEGVGGAVAIEPQTDGLSEVHATRVALRNNVASRGGAIAADRVILVDVEVDGNAADEGGGLDVYELSATRTTFVDNRALGAPGTGGAVRASGDVTLVNTTFSANRARVGASVWMSAVASPTLFATYTTFASAAADDDGAHVTADVTGGGTATIVLRGSVLAGVAALGPAGATLPLACAGFVAPTGDGATSGSVDSLAVDTSCGTGVAVLASEPAFAPLPPAGAAVRTGMLARVHLPDAAGTLIDAIACDAGWPSTDQRGLARPQPSEGRCDAGAVELAVTDSDVDTGTPGSESETTAPAPGQSDRRVPARIQAGAGPMSQRPWLAFWRWRAHPGI
jgi:hypothetical protein